MLTDQLVRHFLPLLLKKENVAQSAIVDVTRNADVIPVPLDSRLFVIADDEQVAGYFCGFRVIAAFGDFAENRPFARTGQGVFTRIAFQPDCLDLPGKGAFGRRRVHGIGKRLDVFGAVHCPPGAGDIGDDCVLYIPRADGETEGIGGCFPGFQPRKKPSVRRTS